MKPAFPTVVYWMPICWKLLARHRATPQQIPPASSVFAVLFFLFAGDFFLPLPFFPLQGKIHGISTSPPRILLTKLKVNGPTYSIPRSGQQTPRPRCMPSVKQCGTSQISFFIFTIPSLFHWLSSYSFLFSKVNGGFLYVFNEIS